ncbi:DUF6022 family protein [Paenibacillus arenilitoris]|uniref:Uncharacterized protein n=1 Tax=Paenibacillus arenilitoris TaxID=2772299 RepID=A0A927CQ01_9BACL|nr:DUF6022 family protein [Paenibacillus arenilitoris]MBD2871395.1 hypothetical protein [Paenibacillus arenilitoris]
MSQLKETFKETTMNMLAGYAEQYIENHWRQVWERNLEEIERIYARGGDSAYGFFCLKLFKPLESEIYDAGFTPRPVMPGLFPQSQEHWGPWEERERRFWSVIHMNGEAVGTLVSRVFHDHTRLRVPGPPRVYAIPETDPDKIAEALIGFDPDSGHSKGWRNGTHA